MIHSGVDRLVASILVAALSVPASVVGADSDRMPLLMPDDFSELNLVGWRVELGTPDANNPRIEGEMPRDSGGERLASRRDRGSSSPSSAGGDNGHGLDNCGLPFAYFLISLLPS